MYDEDEWLWSGKSILSREEMLLAVNKIKTSKSKKMKLPTFIHLI
jgi:hypothetical protein